MERLKICEVLGVEIGQVFACVSFNDYDGMYTNYYKVCDTGNVTIRGQKNGTGYRWNVARPEDLCWIINNPDRILRFGDCVDDTIESPIEYFTSALSKIIDVPFRKEDLSATEKAVVIACRQQWPEWSKIHLAEITEVDTIENHPCSSLNVLEKCLKEIDSKKETREEKRIREIIQYEVGARSKSYQKQLKGFLLTDTIEEKEQIFKALEPLISKLRVKTAFETEYEKMFWDSYFEIIAKRKKNIDDYSLCPQCEIEGSIAIFKPYRADFLHKQTKTIIEINGAIHNTTEQRKYDRTRTEKLNELGYTVVSFTNDEVEEDGLSCAKEALDIIERRMK